MRRSPAAIGVIVLTALVSACASGGTHRPSPFPSPSPPPSAGGQPPSIADGSAIVRAALDLRGLPYAAGASGPAAFDCSGFVHYVFARHGIAVPRTVNAQYGATGAIAADAVQPGDLLFFRIEGSKPAHVAIAIGDGSFVHAPSSKGTVRVERLDAPYWRHRFQGARRVLPRPPADDPR